MTTDKEYLLEREPSKRVYIIEVINEKGFRLLVADKEKKDDEAYCLIDGSNLVEFGMFGVYQGKVPELDCDFYKNVLESNTQWFKFELIDNKQERCNHFWEESNMQEGLMFCGKCMMRLEDFNKKYNINKQQEQEEEREGEGEGEEEKQEQKLSEKSVEDLWKYDHFE